MYFSRCFIALACAVTGCYCCLSVSALLQCSLLAKPAPVVQTLAWKPSRSQPKGTRWHSCTTSVVFSHLSSPPRCSGGRERSKQFLQNKTAKLSEDHMATSTQQGLPYAQSKIQKYTRLSASTSLLSSPCFVFFSCRLALRRDFVWFEGALALAVVFCSCVVSLQRRRQQHKQERELHFRATKEEERGMTRRRRRKRRKRGGVFSIISEGLSTNWEQGREGGEGEKDRDEGGKRGGRGDERERQDMKSDSEEKKKKKGWEGDRRKGRNNVNAIS